MSSVKLRKEKDCLNCGRIVEENFCPHCGQENIVVKEDAFHMVAHAIADYFHFEHKFFGTIRPLLLKPGVLTKEYVSGKRMAFIHPIRLYIFLSIVFFLIILSGSGIKNNVSSDKLKKGTTSSKPVKKSADTTKVKKQLTEAEIQNIKESLQYVPNKNGFRDTIIKKAIASESSDGENQGPSFRIGNGKKHSWSNNWATSDTSVAQYEKHQAGLAKDKRDGFIKHYFLKRTMELNEFENPEEKFLEDFLHNIPKMMFLLLPMFALILKLVYINKNKYYYEHLIYSFHIHSAIFLSILLTTLLKWIFGFMFDISTWLSILCTIYIIWYIYRSLRTFYASTRWVTVLKMFFLFFVYNIILILCFLVIIALSFLTI